MLMQNSFHFNYTLQLGDNALILSQRLGEWCGHGPVLEQDIALTNIALDLLGQARMFLTHAGQLEGKNRDEDQLAFLREAHDFRNCLLLEQPNQDFAYTIARQFFFDVFNYFNLKELITSADEHLAAIAEKALKEATYHLRFSSEWMVRLGDGTEISHQKIQSAVDDLWMFTGELVTSSDAEIALAQVGIAPDLSKIKQLWQGKVSEILKEATLTIPPSDTWMQLGGKEGRHTEYLGFVLAEMQHLQRTYPGAPW